MRSADFATSLENVTASAAHPVALGGLDVGCCRHFRLAICVNLLSSAA